MKLSKPEKYIEILLKDFVDKVTNATQRYYRTIYGNEDSLQNAALSLEKELNRIEEIKNEILEICFNQKGE